MAFPLFTFALQSESAHHFDDVATLYTGVGKVNATLALTRYLTDAVQQNNTPSLIINCGTVGARTHAPGTILQCRQFVQRDMDVTALGFPAFQTPFDDTPTLITPPGPDVTGIPYAICGTGDHFVTKWPDDAPFDIVDMEGYALARVCMAMNIPFIAIKYVSDNADGTAHVDWGAALDRAARGLRAAVDLLR